MQIILILLLGLGIGGVVAWLWANAKTKSELATYKIQAEGNLRRQQLRPQILRPFPQVKARHKMMQLLADSAHRFTSLRCTAAKLALLQVLLKEVNDGLDLGTGQCRMGGSVISHDTGGTNIEPLAKFLQGATASTVIPNHSARVSRWRNSGIVRVVDRELERSQISDSIWVHQSRTLKIGTGDKTDYVSPQEGFCLGTWIAANCYGRVLSWCTGSLGEVEESAAWDFVVEDQSGHIQTLVPYTPECRLEAPVVFGRVRA